LPAGRVPIPRGRRRRFVRGPEGGSAKSASPRKSGRSGRAGEQFEDVFGCAPRTSNPLPHASASSRSRGGAGRGIRPGAPCEPSRPTCRSHPAARPPRPDRMVGDVGHRRVLDAGKLDRVPSRRRSGPASELMCHPGVRRPALSRSAPTGSSARENCRACAIARVRAALQPPASGS